MVSGTIFPVRLDSVNTKKKWGKEERLFDISFFPPQIFCFHLGLLLACFDWLFYLLRFFLNLSSRRRFSYLSLRGPYWLPRRAVATLLVGQVMSLTARAWLFCSFLGYVTRNSIIRSGYKLVFFFRRFHINGFVFICRNAYLSYITTIISSSYVCFLNF